MTPIVWFVSKNDRSSCAQRASWFYLFGLYRVSFWLFGVLKLFYQRMTRRSMLFNSSNSPASSSSDSMPQSTGANSHLAEEPEAEPSGKTAYEVPAPIIAPPAISAEMADESLCMMLQRLGRSLSPYRKRSVTKVWTLNITQRSGGTKTASTPKWPLWPRWTQTQKTPSLPGVSVRGSR